MIPANDEQVRLTETWILPHEELILKDLRAIRREVDDMFSEDPEMMEHMNGLKKEYPYGQCKPIRDEVFERMKISMLDTSRPGMQKLRGFVEEGGIVQPFWGIDSGKYFQNAIQVGNGILDVANDTVFIAKEPVVFHPELATAPIKPIKNFTEYAQIEERYWDHDVYPNIYLPELAPVFPIISIELARRTTGGYMQLLMLQTDIADLQFKNLFAELEGRLFGLSSAFLFKSDFSQKRLPEAVLDSLLANKNLKKRQEEHSTFFRTATEPEEARAIFERFRVEKRVVVSPEHIKQAGVIRDKGLMLERVVLGEKLD
ncbi:MAG: hypothetical protein P4M11_05570 [Candidatus Pacebacteria bacterium]|nr:hypothetical protein [Candidatus Paceibacterota bacterium]